MCIMQKGTKHKPESIKAMSESIRKKWEEIPADKRKERLLIANKARWVDKKT